MQELLERIFAYTKHHCRQCVRCQCDYGCNTFDFWNAAHDVLTTTTEIDDVMERYITRLDDQLKAAGF